MEKTYLMAATLQDPLEAVSRAAALEAQASAPFCRLASLFVALSNVFVADHDELMT